MTVEKFMIIIKITMVLHGLVTVLCFLFFKQRGLHIKFLGANFLCLFLSYHSMGVFDLRGMEVNIPTNIEILTSFLTLTALYYTQFLRRNTSFFLVLVGLFTIFWFINIFFIQKTHFNSYSASILNFIVITYCMIYFYSLLRDLPTLHLHQVPMFWISAGFLVQGASATFLYLFTDYLTHFFFNDVLIYWTIYSLIGIFQLFLMIIGVSIDLRNAIVAWRKVYPDVSHKESLFR